MRERERERERERLHHLIRPTDVYCYVTDNRYREQCYSTERHSSHCWWLEALHSCPRVTQSLTLQPDWPCYRRAHGCIQVKLWNEFEYPRGIVLSLSLSLMKILLECVTHETDAFLCVAKIVGFVVQQDWQARLRTHRLMVKHDA